MSKKPIKLELHKIYDYLTIEELIAEHELYDKDGYLASIDEEILGGVGDETWAFYFYDGTLACNFILHTLSETANRWRCIYVCAVLSATGKVQV